MRDLTKVVEEIIALIPADADGGAQVVYRLRSILRKGLYTAPEAMVDRWIDVMHALNHGLPDPGPDAPEWCRKIQAVFMGKPYTPDDGVNLE